MVETAGHALPEPQPDGFRDDLAQVARGAPHQGEGTVEKGRVATAEARVGLRAALERRRRVLAPRGGRGQHALELVEVVRDGQDEELLLGREVAIDEAAGDAHRPRDLLDRRVLHAALVEQRSRGDHKIAFPRLAQGGGL